MRYNNLELIPKNQEFNFNINEFYFSELLI